MNSSDETRDDGLRRALQALPLPPTPASAPGLVRRRLRRRRARQATAVAAAFVAAGLVVWQPWVKQPGVPDSRRETPVAARELSPQEIDELFAPPPVDALTILSRRDDVLVVALGRLEEPK